MIAVSEFSADELATHTPIPRARIRVVPNGVDLERAAPDAVARARAAYGIGDRPYVLWVGTLQPRKNVDLLVEAFRDAIAGSRLPHVLVLVGAQGWLAPTSPRGRGDDDRVLTPGAIGRPDLTALYAGAELFAFPSVHEGFGLPALEAMAQGTAVLASDIPVFHEVGGDVARFVDPRDVDGWRRALTGLLGEGGEREERGARGPGHAADFSWDRCIERTTAVYREALV